jgi:hypothetical protein
MRKSGKVSSLITKTLSVQTVARDGNCLFRILSTLLEDECRYSTLRHKEVQSVYAASDGQIILSLATADDQAESEGSTCVPRVLNRHHSFSWPKSGLIPYTNKESR